MPVGDVTSNKRGSGARFNDGKPNLSLIPPKLLPAGGDEHSRLLEALNELMFSGQSDELSKWHSHMMLTHSSKCAEVFTYGKQKYAAWNWAKGMSWSIPIASALRHAEALWIRREDTDPESGLPHIAHILCNTTMLLHYEKHYPEGNDLPYRVIGS